jgi:hypothetical protein
LEEPTYRYVIGIDLGTTNSAVAFIELAGGASAGLGMRPDPESRIQTFEIPQLIAPGEIGKRPVLPSFLYLPGQYDLPPDSSALPWAPARGYIVGEFAREQGARAQRAPAGRLVASAKSWLGHAGVDRTAPILPWGAPQEIPKVSPVEASKRYLQHIREAWNAQMAGEQPDARLEDQLIVLTVPASFDEVARELTLDAARQAGIARAILLEEPLAAVYAWLSQHETTWQTQMQDGQMILVCDVGGGTTDFTVVGVRAGEQGLRLNRLAVGEHLMLGGDNMDLALGRHIEIKLFGQPGKLDAQRWQQLVQQCRRAKELLLDAPPLNPPQAGGDIVGVRPETIDITVMGAGSQLIAGTLKSSLTQAEVQRLIVDGFAPEVRLAEPPGSPRRPGLVELGLPYVHDPAITRHLAAFWRRFEPLLQEESGRATVYPDYVLFNGGALGPAAIRQRLRTLLQSWFQPVAGDAPGGAPPLCPPQAGGDSGGVSQGAALVELPNPRPDLAVAVGAAYYGLVRLGEGVRIGSGSPRAYYVGVEAGEQDASQEVYTAVCLAPRGVEEGFQARLAQPQFAALTNQPVAFQIYTSSTRLGDRLGDVVNLAAEEVSILPPIRTVLRYGKRGVAQPLPVHLEIELTEVGTLALWCQSKQTEHRWQLQFDVRQGVAPGCPLGSENPSLESPPAWGGHRGGAPQAGGDTGGVHSTPVANTTIEQALIEAAQVEIQRTFDQARAATDHPPEGVRKRLETILDLPKEEWPTLLIRKLADTLLGVAEGRKRSFAHEAYWLNLLGFCLRPGFGDPADELRMKEVWKLYLQGLSFANKPQSRTEWWVFWRRVAGGLKAGHQLQIYDQLRSALPVAAPQKKNTGRGASTRLGPGEELEVWMALANFEWLPSDVKAELGRLLLQKFDKAPPKAQELWALSRFGSRTTIYGPLDRLVANTEAAGWLQQLLTLPLEKTDAVARALIHLGRVTGDRSRDVPADLREQVLAWLASLPHAQRLQELLLDPESHRQREEQAWVFGEALPAGLVLSS